MSSDDTIREIKERLREEGYTAGTIGEVLREVDRSFLADEAGEVIRETQAKALQLRSVLEGIYEALIGEPGLDLRISGEEELPIGSASDRIDLYLAKRHGDRLALSFESSLRHPARPEEEIRLGRLAEKDAGSAGQKGSAPVYRRVVVARITIRPADERSADGGLYDMRFDLNREVLESDEVRHDAETRFHDCYTFVDYASDRYYHDTYPVLVQAISKLPERIGTYLGRKREFLDRFDFS